MGSSGLAVTKRSDMKLVQLNILVLGFTLDSGWAVSVKRGHGKEIPPRRTVSLGRLATAAFESVFSIFSPEDVRQDNSSVTSTSATTTSSSPLNVSGECRADFFQVGDSCFYVSRNLLARNWVEAQIACMELNSTLATIANKEELQSIQSNCSYIGKFFIGGTDSGSENHWRWSSRSEWKFENWKSGEPNGGGRENCMEMEASGLGLWNDIDCVGFASRCNEVGHTACNHRPSAEPKRYVCGYSLKQQQAPEQQDCGIWTMNDVKKLEEEEEARPAFVLPFIPIMGRGSQEDWGRGGKGD
eukprot:TRINITY_DN7254_c0_g1_i2.p1 TRINITY_DN7254_c0_g1~~TRINITY_DN7254_c0_g1_i2.p1  ORF type:complete len:300 (+),score=93.02 TRINITY_DN7254_c0_g1_i2:186-1085(+)